MFTQALVYFFHSFAMAQVDPGVRPGLVLSVVGGEPVAHITVASTRHGSFGEYAYVGEEHWLWSSDPWPDETLVLSSGGERLSEGREKASFHQALFPEAANLYRFPEGDRIYALYWEDGEAVGWLVVEDAGDAESEISWILSEEAEVGELLDVSEQDLFLKPISAPEITGKWRAVLQGAI